MKLKIFLVGTALAFLFHFHGESRAAVNSVLGFLVVQQTSPEQSSQSRTHPTESVSVRRGEWVFIQRCSLCHLPKTTKAKVHAVAPRGPLLKGLFKGDNPRSEETVREFILKGSPTMPGFQYGLRPNEMDEIIAYLKSL